MLFVFDSSELYSQLCLWLFGHTEYDLRTPSRGEARDPTGTNHPDGNPAKVREGNLEEYLVSDAWWTKPTIQ